MNHRPICNNKITPDISYHYRLLKRDTSKIYTEFEWLLTMGAPINGAISPLSLAIILDDPTARWRIGVGNSSAVNT